MIDNYRLLRESRKTMAIHVLPSCDIIVKVPITAKQSEIERFIKRKNLWIEKQLNYFKDVGFKKKDKELVNGSEVFYLGKQYRLIVRKVTNPKEYIEVDKTDLIVYSMFPNKQDRNLNIFNNWLDLQIQKQFKRALNNALKKFPNLSKPEFKVRKLSRRWGSFLKKGIVVLNPSLIIVPKKCIEYVITHELCHSYYKDHSTAFYSLLGAKIPDWDKTKEKLETYSKYI